MKLGFLAHPTLTLHKTESAKSPSGTALDFARPAGTDRDGSETNRSQCKTVLSRSGYLTSPSRVA
jgi:hypothetical protein